MEQLQVEIHLNHELTRNELDTMEYDTLVFATGALAKKFPLRDSTPVMTAKEALRDPAKIGNNVVIVGGGMVGCELALWLKQDLDKQVTIVESLHKLLAVNAPICSANREMLERLIPFVGCNVLVNTAAVMTTPNGLCVKDVNSGEKSDISAETVILAIGFQSDTSLYDQMQDAEEIYAIGDCKQFKNVHQAVWDAYEVANHI